ncbi:preprotein translocase subunit YajC [Spirochaeta cellobiosiphila]|uniref:preprotein translocase subunit YajC n=1 Tax=Spirochaeta cellobiosiphila TaxID=504483 RepID=UPI0003F6E9B5|nr:preprotein translocase subunit YajC [Spirochaeta cellobiosiphila]
MFLNQLLLQTSGTPGPEMMGTLITFGLVFLVFYFLIIRPQNKKQKETKKMIAAIKKGDKVTSIGGIKGIVHTVKEDSVLVTVDDNTKLEFTKGAISDVEVKDAPKPVEKKKDKK